jgi:predicted DNA-binding protein (MmcQ/YjbR family)
VKSRAAGKLGARSGRTSAATRLRALCLALPGAHEQITWGHPTYRVGAKMFAACGDGTGRFALSAKAPRGAQEALIAYDPARYFLPAYVGKAGWVGVYLDGRVPWSQVAALVEQAWRMTAPKKLAAKLPRSAET